MSDFSCELHRKEIEKPGRDIGNAFSHCPANHRRITSRNIERPMAEAVRRETEENGLSACAAVRELQFNATPRAFLPPRDFFSLKTRKGK